MLDKKLLLTIEEFVISINERSKPVLKGDPDPFWQNLRKIGTELWLDTGDMKEAAKVWSAEMSALTTNNTLLNKEIQKGIYDDFIMEANDFLKDLDMKQRVIEIAFILNAHHGLRLSKQFGGKVNVELHTNLAHDLEGIVDYGTRLYNINPAHFIIKVPYTSTGLLGAKKLMEMGVQVNCTLEFSARQNALVSAVAKPSCLNVFLGRLGTYLLDNQLGDGLLVGEKATLAAQKVILNKRQKNANRTKLIAASMRNALQLETLAGVDVFTIPPVVAKAGKNELSGQFYSRLEEDYPVNLKPGVDSRMVEKLWIVNDEVYELAEELDQNPPTSGIKLKEQASVSLL